MGLVLIVNFRIHILTGDHNVIDFSGGSHASCVESGHKYIEDVVQGAILSVSVIKLIKEFDATQ